MYILKIKNSATDEFESVNENGNLTAADWTPETGWASANRDQSFPRPAAGIFLLSI